MLTYDSEFEEPTEVTCALETLMSSLQIEKPNLIGVENLHVVKVDLKILRDTVSDPETTAENASSAHRLLNDLTLPNQIYYFMKGRNWLYRGSTLVSEGGLGQLLMFKDRTERFNNLDLTTEEQVQDFLNFDKLPRNDKFPLSELDHNFDFYDNLPMKTRIICPS